MIRANNPLQAALAKKKKHVLQFALRYGGA